MHQTPEMSGLAEPEPAFYDCPHMPQGILPVAVAIRNVGTDDIWRIHYCVNHKLRMCPACTEEHKLTCEVIEA